MARDLEGGAPSPPVRDVYSFPAVHLALFATGTVRRGAERRTARELRRAARDLARTLRDVPVKDVVRLAKDMVAQGDRQLAYELLAAHEPALASLGARDVVALGEGIASWGTVDHFACFVAGQAWRRGRIRDTLILRWAHSRDRHWRRAALVSTVSLNARSRGGEGDAPRTLAVCALLVGDRDALVVKALSRALRELAKRDRRAVERFLGKHDAALAPRVKREVTNKLRTGAKAPRKSGRRAIADR